MIDDEWEPNGVMELNPDLILAGTDSPEYIERERLKLEKLKLEESKRPTIKFKDYVDHVNKILKDNPKIGEYKTVIATDFHENKFEEVKFEARAGFWDGEEYDEYGNMEHDKPELSAIILN